MRLLILDRDGVINEDSEAFVKSVDEWIPIAGSLEAIAHANQIGFSVVVVTNQSGLARGLLDIDTLNKIHTRMIKEISRYGGRIEAVFFCPHGPDDECLCRKPKPGLLIEAGKRLNVDLKSATFVGDRDSDLAAARAVGARQMLVETGHGQSTKSTLELGSGVIVSRDLADAVQWLSENT
jgi:D-glycero-D-manno-heptose 1,7-bisphosphate phosphatase